MPRAACLVLVLLLAACDGGGDNTPAAADRSTTSTITAGTIDLDGAPETFFAVVDHDTEIVEVETSTGRVRRTLVDVGPWREPPAEGRDENIYIGGLDVAPDGRTLWYGAGLLFANGSVFRLSVDGGAPAEVAAGHGPSVSPDGARLAWIDGTTLRIRDLGSGEERALPDEIGLEGQNATWSVDSAKVAWLSVGADSIGVGAVDIATGASTGPPDASPVEGVSYTPYAPRYRPSDGVLAVLCCGEVPDPPPDYKPGPPALVLHDPTSGHEVDRVVLPFAPSGHDYTRQGDHHLLIGPDGEVYLRREGRLIRIPAIRQVGDVAW